jgi:hypothetical protein
MAGKWNKPFQYITVTKEYKKKNMISIRLKSHEYARLGKGGKIRVSKCYNHESVIAVPTIFYENEAL